MQKTGLFIGLIPDGNRRAVGNDVSRYAEAYRNGAESVSAMLKSVVQDERVRIFTAWGLSDDNIRKRNPFELEILNGLIAEYLEQLDRDMQTPEYEGVRVVHLGNERLLQDDVRDRLDTVVARTRERQEKIFGMCLGYGGAEELERASNRKSEHVRMRGSAPALQQFLDIPFRGNMPFTPVDMIVRTGTEGRAYTSAYLTGYQTGSTEELYIPKLLPDTTPEDLAAAIDAYEKINPRLGK